MQIVMLDKESKYLFLVANIWFVGGGLLILCQQKAMHKLLNLQCMFIYYSTGNEPKERRATIDNARMTFL